MSKNKKKNTLKSVGMLIYILAGIGISLCITNVSISLGIDDQTTSGYFAMFGLILIMIYFSIFCHTIIHETGHLVFGRLTGYTFTSFRIGSLLWLKEDGKLKMKKYMVPGTAGQCLMRPPKQVKGRFPVVLYNLGGCILNTVFSIIFLVLTFRLEREKYPLGYFYCVAMIFVGFAVALTNGIPLSTNVIRNDGKNAQYLRKDKEARQAFWVRMEMYYLLSTGVTTKEMPAEWFVKPFKEDMQNPMLAKNGVLHCNYLMDRMKFKQAKSEMLEIVNEDNAVSDFDKALLINDIIYCELTDGCNKENIDLLLTKQQKKIMKSLKCYPEVIRTEYAYALIYEQNRKKVDKLMKSFEKIAKTYPYRTSIDSERELITYANNITKES